MSHIVEGGFATIRVKGHTVGLHGDGTVVAAGWNKYGQCDVSDWRNVVAISAKLSNTVGLRADGMVMAAGNNEYGQCNVSDWRDIIAVSAGGDHTVGLRADGTVVAVGSNEDGQCKVSAWRDIIAISAGGYHTAGLHADGTVIAVGNNEYGQCNVSDWKDIGVNLDKVREAEKQWRGAEERAKNWERQGFCRFCGGRLVSAGFLGILGKKCKSCGKYN
jgi:alpha-tubulin suppressor-like RCC1 family protein